MKHLSTQIATKAPAKKQSTYGAFIVDLTFNFDNIHVERTVQKSPSTANFSRPLSIRPTFLSDDPDPKAVFGLPELSRQSSLASSWRDSGFSTAPSTPVPGTPPVTQFPTGSTIVSSDDSVHIDTARLPSAMESSKFADRMSFTMLGQSGSPELDLTFPAEKLLAHHTERPRPSLLRWNDSRLGTATDLIDAIKDTTQDVDKAACAKPLIATFLPPNGNRFEEVRSAPPTTTSFPEFKQALVGQQEFQKAASVRSGPPSLALPFLQQDPFKCPIHGDKRERPKSAGVGSSPLSQQSDTTGGIDFAAPVKKQGTPSVMSMKSARSIRSIKKRFSRFKKIMKGPLNDEDNV